MAKQTANKISWFEIIGGEASKLHSFYSELFGWKIEVPDPKMKYGLVDAAATGVGGGIGPSMDGSPGYVTVYVGVDDINAAMKRVEKLGGTTVMPPTPLPDFGLTFALFKDPEGHVIGLTQG